MTGPQHTQHMGTTIPAAVQDDLRVGVYALKQIAEDPKDRDFTAGETVKLKSAATWIETNLLGGGVTGGGGGGGPTT